MGSTSLLDLEIGRILHLKSEILDGTTILCLPSVTPGKMTRSIDSGSGKARGGRVRSDISDFGFEMQDSSNFQCPRSLEGVAGFALWLRCAMLSSLVSMPDRIYDNICQLIGRTPIVRLNRIPENGWAEMLAKLESFNPGGSVKDRIGLSMIEAAALVKEALGEVGAARLQIVEDLRHTVEVIPMDSVVQEALCLGVGDALAGHLSGRRVAVLRLHAVAVGHVLRVAQRSVVGEGHVGRRADRDVQQVLPLVVPVRDGLIGDRQHAEGRRSRTATGNSGLSCGFRSSMLCARLADAKCSLGPGRGRMKEL